VISEDTNPSGKDFARSAVVVALCFIVPLAALVAWSVAERRGGADLERFVKVSAVGDEPTFVKPAKFDSAVALASFEGRPLFPAAEPETKIFDSLMRRAGVDGKSGAVIYECVDEDERGNFFLKTAMDHYVRLAEKPAGK
jgi:hypothetical protein